jgi:hypothetical protein
MTETLQQILEDESFYLKCKLEAERQLVFKSQRQLVDPMRSNIMGIYTIYDEDSAKYKNKCPIELVNEIIKQKIAQ